jgi:hypothetical protein
MSNYDDDGSVVGIIFGIIFIVFLVFVAYQCSTHRGGYEITDLSSGKVYVVDIYWDVSRSASITFDYDGEKITLSSYKIRKLRS